MGKSVLKSKYGFLNSEVKLYRYFYQRASCKVAVAPLRAKIILEREGSVRAVLVRACDVRLFKSLVLILVQELRSNIIWLEHNF